jgi:hypothetical protein
MCLIPKPIFNMSLKKYHITKTRDGWQGKAEGGQRASKTAPTKEVILDQMIDMAKRQGDVSLIIHKSDGTFQEERTYPRSSDPRISKG